MHSLFFFKDQYTDTRYVQVEIVLNQIQERKT